MNNSNNQLENHSLEDDPLTQFDGMSVPAPNSVLMPVETVENKIMIQLIFQFIRHALSCNNIAGITNKDFEPSITNYGIKKTSQFSFDNPNFTSNHVYVSNLIRTWITAFLLYGVNIRHINDNKLNLYISPYLKEKHQETLGVAIKPGNYPEQHKRSIKKFLKAINTIVVVNDDYTYPDTVLLHYPPPETSITNSAQIVEFTKQATGEYTFNESQACNIIDSCGPELTNSLEKTQFLKTGDLQKFMAWFNTPYEYNNNTNYYGVNLSNNIDAEKRVVCVVTHSQAMQSYLKTQFNLQIDSEKASDPVEIETAKEFNNVRHSNSWWFQVPEIIETPLLPTIPDYLVELNIAGFYNLYNRYIPVLHQGVSNTNMKSYIGAEQIAVQKGISLCGRSGNVEDVICTSNSSRSWNPFSRTRSNGGKKTKRRTTRKTKRNKMQKTKQRKYKKSRK